MGLTAAEPRRGPHRTGRRCMTGQTDPGSIHPVRRVVSELEVSAGLDSLIGGPWMKSMTLLVAALLLAGTLISCSQSGQDEAATASVTELTTFAQKSSYAIGVNVASSLSQVKDDLDQAAFFQGLRDALAGRDLLLSDEEAQQVMQEFTKNMQTRQAADRSAASTRNLEEGRAFLAKNKEQEGVITTASGLQYRVLREGTGPSPKATDRVTVNYSGKLIDGTEFDSSYKRGEPATFAVNGVIKGWSEALQLMKVGGKYELFIPSDLAYGERGAGQSIGPNATLIFEVELLKIED
jgi:FKBP-type peptidyl-prolyl cis-trans isomerase